MAYTPFEVGARHEACGVPPHVCPSDDHTLRYLICPSTFQNFGRGGGDVATVLILGLVLSVGVNLYLLLRNRTLRRRLDAFLRAVPPCPSSPKTASKEDLAKINEADKESEETKGKRSAANETRRLSRTPRIDDPNVV